ncbi:MAG: hypothetical protein ACTSU2_14135 [Promethearchaeota archaeon]
MMDDDNLFDDDENKQISDGITYVEDTESERSLGLSILTLIIAILPFPLLLIAFISGVSWALGANARLSFITFFILGILSWIVAPGLWKLKKYAFILTFVGLVLAIIASSLSFFSYLLTGFWNPGEDFVYWAGVVELVIYSWGIIVLILNRRKFFEYKKF